MNSNVALVITTINSPMQPFEDSRGCRNKYTMIVVGDSKSPSNFHIPGVEYFDLKAQRESGLAYASFARMTLCQKNIGYLLACRGTPNL